MKERRAPAAGHDRADGSDRVEDRGGADNSVDDDLVGLFDGVVADRAAVLDGEVVTVTTL